MGSGTCQRFDRPISAATSAAESLRGFRYRYCGWVAERANVSAVLFLMQPLAAESLHGFRYRYCKWVAERANVSAVLFLMQPQQPKAYAASATDTADG